LRASRFAINSTTRAPIRVLQDIILKTNTGVIFTGGSKLSEHGGFNEDDTHVALLVSIPGLSPRHIKTPVTNQQVPATIARALGINPENLDAVRKEQIQVVAVPLYGRGSRRQEITTLQRKTKRPGCASTRAFVLKALDRTRKLGLARHPGMVWRRKGIP